MENKDVLTDEIEEKMVIISVIVPHYNMPNSLIRLINSIVDNMMVEIIVVDDNSTQPIQEVFEKFLNRRNVFFYKLPIEKKGAGAARNMGLDKAHGEWILFADADDYFQENVWDSILKCQSRKEDIIYFAPTSINLQTGEKTTRHVMYANLVRNYGLKPSTKNEIALRFGFCTPWSKLIRRNVIEQNHIRFDEIMVSNDIMAMTMIAHNAKSIACEKDEIYCVTRAANTLTSVRNKDFFMIRVDTLIRRYQFLKSHLDKRTFKMTKIDRIALVRLVDCISERYGIQMLIEVLSKYWKNGIRFWDMGLFNPALIYRYARMHLKWWYDIRKVRDRV